MNGRERGTFAAKTSAWRKWLLGLREPQDMEELVEWLHDAKRRQLFDADALGMIEGALQVKNMHARDIMVPATDMISIRSDQLPEAFITDVIKSGHSRFPVIGDNRDDIEGILLAKDMLYYFAHRDEQSFNLRDVMRPVVFIPESMRLNVLLGEFRARRNHMAIVVDEYSGVAGLVTIEDVIEQIIGDIDDEHDIDEGNYIKSHKNGEVTVQARMPIEDFNEYFNTDYSDEEFDTIGGLVIQRLQRLPKTGEILTIDDWNFQVVRADSRQLHLLKIIRSAPGSASDQQP